MSEAGRPVWQVYRLVAPDGRCYVGASGWVHLRLYDYRMGRSTSTPRLHDAFQIWPFDKWGIDCPLEICASSEAMDAAEMKWIAHFRSNEREFGFNITRGARHGHVRDLPHRRAHYAAMVAAGTGTIA